MKIIPKRKLTSYSAILLPFTADRPLQRRHICRTFSDCTSAPRNGMVSGCYPLDAFYKARPEAEVLKALKKGSH